MGRTSWCRAVAGWLALTLVATGAAQAATPLSGTVTSEETGEPRSGIVIGIARESSLAGLEATDRVAFEWFASTDALGEYTITLDEALPGMDRLIVFTNHPVVFNELYGGVDLHAMSPWFQDVQDPGVVFVDLTAGAVTGVDFVVASSKRNERMPAADGTELGTDIWLPSRIPGLAWPVLMMRTPYGRGSAARYMIDNDYAVVVQSSRGRQDSDGEDMVFDADGWGEHQDGYDAVAWAVAQPWSNGKLCTYGGSANGISQYRLVGTAPPGLVCSAIEIATATPYAHMFYPGGAFREHMIETWLTNNGSLHKLPEYHDHPNDDAYWQDRDLMNRISIVETPAIHIGGWYDIFSEGTLGAFRAMHEDAAAGARRNQKLVIGPWIHGLYGSPFQGDLRYPDNSTFSLDQTLIRWFDFWLKGEDTGIMDEPPARYYVMGPGDGGPTGNGVGNVWRTGDSWPPPATATSYYLHKNGSLRTVPPNGGSGESTWVSDPAAPVPTDGGNNLYADIGRGPTVQNLVDDRADVVTWETQALNSAIEISGTVRMELHAASDRTDTDWVVKLEDVYPDGNAILVTDLVLRARHRNGHDQEALLTPNTVYVFDVELWDTSITFDKGHRIRVAVASSNSPRFDVNPQTGETVHQHTSTEIATNRVLTHSNAPSRLILPVVDAAQVEGCAASAAVTGLTVERLGGDSVRLSWDAVSDPCHRRYRVYAGIEGAGWPWIVRRPVVETGDTTVDVEDVGVFWQVVSEGTDGGNGPR